MSFTSTPDTPAENDELLLILASSGALAAAGMDMGLIDAVPCPPSSAGDAANAGTGSPLRIMIGRLRAANGESVNAVRSQLFHAAGRRRARLRWAVSAEKVTGNHGCGGRRAVTRHAMTICRLRGEHLPPATRNFNNHHQRWTV